MSIRTLVLALAATVALATTAFAQATGGSPGHAGKYHPSVFARIHPLNPQPLPPRKVPLV
jgi:hypothetical protein